MFRWDFAKSAEAMLSRWAIKRLCKFLLKKKKLGDYIDLDQLDVQLAEGAIQLRDLALNVDFINQKLGDMPIFVREGTIISLSIKIPWKSRNCQIEVEDLELIVAPCGGCGMPTDTVVSLQNSDEKESKRNAFGKSEQVMGPGNLTSLSLDIHEGVKTIAKIVKWFLTSFNIRVRNMIIAFDPSSNMDGKGSHSQRNLVLRIAEMEFGTYVSEDDVSKCNSLLGISRLTNFIKFHGAVIDFLEMDDPFTSETSFNMLYSRGSPSGRTFQVLSGTDGGFSGVLNLSIPWKHGSLDIKKIDADISVDPVKIWLQPNTIRWIIFLWDSLRNAKKIRSSHVDMAKSDITHQAYTLGTTYSEGIKRLPSQGFFHMDIDSQMNQGLEGTSHSPHIIQNWVTSENGIRDHGVLEPDYGASIDQFFECFDEMRSSHASLGSSGMWNWTYSVFSAITAASSLASESAYIPNEQQYMETNLRAKVSAVSIILSFEDQIDCCQNLMGSCMRTDDLYKSVYDTFLDNPSQTLHYAESKLQGLVLTLQMGQKSTEVEVMISQIIINDFISVGIGSEKCCSMVSHLQAGVQSMLPPWPSTAKTDPHSAPFSSNVQLFHESYESFGGNYNSIPKEELIKIQLLDSLGTCCCRYFANSNNASDEANTISLFLYLPQFILWVDFSLVNMLMELWQKVGSSSGDVKVGKFTSDVSEEKNDASSQDACSGTCIKNIPSGETLRGDVFLSCSRIILCFPCDSAGNLQKLYCWRNFICLEISSLSSATEKSCVAVELPKQDFLKYHSSTVSTSVHLYCGSVDIYLITTLRKNAFGDQSNVNYLPSFDLKKFLCISGGKSNHPVISMLWQKGPVTGPWMAKRAWRLASMKNLRSKRNVSGKGNEFVSVRKADDLQEMSSQVRQEMILSTAFLMHICLPHVWIDLNNYEYKFLSHLLNEILDGLPFHHTAAVEGKHAFENSYNASQTAVFVECNQLDVKLTLDDVVKVSYSLQNELPGSWNSFKLTLQMFELLSVVNVGGLRSESFLWFSHGEGDLWGSIVNMDGPTTSTSSQDLLLITCRNSTMKRGDGEGGNILCCGTAGSSIVHLSNQQLFHSFTSINIQCATIIAPGGRLDWIAAICLYFNSSPRETSAEVENFSEDLASHRHLFLLNLVDVALSYEPSKKNSGILIASSETHICTKHSDESSEQNVGCLVAAASVHLSNQAMGKAADGDYNIQMQDIGLLICEQSGSKCLLENYDVCHLQEAGYVRVAKEALVDLILRTNCPNGLLWEVEVSDVLVDMDTCHDTTSGLSHLVAQLQQLFAPDVEDALVHLQSRWDSINQKNDAHSAVNMHEDSIRLSSPEELSRNDETTTYTGLMDEILDNAFCWQEKQTSQTDSLNSHSGNLLDHGMPKVKYNFEISSPAAGDLSLPNVSLSGSNLNSGTGNIESRCETSSCLPELIERYYMSDLVSQTTSGSLSDRLCKEENNASVSADGECVKVGWYKDSPLVILDDHIPDGSDEYRGKQSPQENELPCDTAVETCIPKGRILLKNIDVIWKMYSGSDWLRTHRTSTCGHHSEIGRDVNVCLELMLSGLCLQYDFYPDGELFVSKLSLSVKDFYLHDRSKNAPWSMVLGYYRSKYQTRESSAKAFKLDLESVKPDPSTPLEEYRLHLAFLPMRLHLHQSQVNFLLSFFDNGSAVGHSPHTANGLGDAKAPIVKHRRAKRQDIVEEALLPFFQKFDICPGIICIDYIPHHVDIAALRGGNYVQLINLVPWRGIDIQLKPVHAVGIYGWGSVCDIVVGEWLEDISHNQVHKMLKGLTPVRSLFSVSSGAVKLVSLPVKMYKEDHRLLKGIQRGAVAFLRSISLEAVGLGVHLASGAHDLLIQTEHVLTRIPSSVPLPQDIMKTSVRHNQPKNARHGIKQAYESLSDGFGKTASALVGTPLKSYQRGAGAGPAFASAIRAAPVAAVTPASAVARALHCTLLGVRNSLDPEHKKESMEKYHGSRS